MTAQTISQTNSKNFFLSAMDRYSKDGFYDLTAHDVYLEAERLYEQFFQAQTPLNAFRLTVVLYHLLEWIVPNSNGKPPPTRPNDGFPPTEDGWKDELVHSLRNYKHYDVLKSLANNSKHHTLSTRAYEKGLAKGFVAGRSVAGERVGQLNLVVHTDTEEVWLREIALHVIQHYRRYFRRIGYLAVITEALQDGDG